MSKRKSNRQVDRVRQWLDAGYPITSLHGFTKLGIVHLPGVIRDLREEGYPLEEKFISVKNRFGEKCSVKEWRRRPEPSNLELGF